MADERKELLTVLWSGADVLRGKMDANEYKYSTSIFQMPILPKPMIS